MSPRTIMLPGLAAAIVAIAALLLAGPSAGTQTGKAPIGAVAGAHPVITIQNYAYHPASLTVKAGTMITVVNRDATQHTLTADGGAFDTGTVQAGQTKRIVASKSGTYSYHCLFHAFMTGTIKVVG